MIPENLPNQWGLIRFSVDLDLGNVTSEMVGEAIMGDNLCSGDDEVIFANGGIDRRIRIFRLPDVNPHRSATLERRIKLTDDKDNAPYVRNTRENGHFVWLSPI